MKTRISVKQIYLTNVNGEEVQTIAFVGLSVLDGDGKIKISVSVGVIFNCPFDN